MKPLTFLVLLALGLIALLYIHIRYESEIEDIRAQIRTLLAGESCAYAWDDQDGIGFDGKWMPEIDTGYAGWRKGPTTTFDCNVRADVFTFAGFLFITLTIGGFYQIALLMVDQYETWRNNQPWKNLS